VARGRRPDPTRLQLYKGAPNHRVNRTEPQPREERATAPDWLPSGARMVWYETAPELEAMGLSFAADTEALATYCALTALKRHALELVANSNVVLVGREGQIVTNPASREARSLALVALAYAREFGLTPAARRTLGSTREDGEDGSIASLLS
jgi:P27 family predicted phage terminase small subunit